MKMKFDQQQEKQQYEATKVLASYEKEELEDAIGLEHEAEGQFDGGGCGGGSILQN